MTPEQLADDLEGLYSRTLAAQRAAAELRRLAAENAALRKDSERFAWIVEHATVSHMHRATKLGVEYPVTFTFKTIVGADELDMRKAIDAAMKETP